jgi:tetratricopeptide (TPR) repeat protein
MTDHRIRRRPLTGNLLEPAEEQHDRLTGPVTVLYPSRLPSSAEARLRFAVARIQASSNVAQDIPKLRQAIKDANPISPEPYIVLANACRAAGQADNAIAAYRQATAKGSTQVAPFIALGELLMERNKVEEAIAVVESATGKVTSSAALWNSLSVLYARGRKPEEAIRAVSKALEIDPDDPVAWLNLGVCLQARQDKKGAEAAYRQALLLQPDLKRAQDYLRLLSENKL